MWLSARGRMHEAIIKGDDVDLKESRHLILKRFTSLHTVYERNLVIDVVSEEHFEIYRALPCPFITC